jgi:hypothetical protein
MEGLGMPIRVERLKATRSAHMRGAFRPRSCHPSGHGYPNRQRIGGRVDVLVHTPTIAMAMRVRCLAPLPTGA